MKEYREVTRLEKAHDRKDFRSGTVELDEWLAKYAWQDQRANNATTFVLTDTDGVVAAYYAITVGGVGREQVPAPAAEGSPTQMGCLLLARFAVDERHQGQGVGRALLADCLRRTVQLAGGVGVRFLLIHCRDDEAKAFYLRQARFMESPTDSLHLLIRVAELQQYR